MARVRRTKSINPTTLKMLDGGLRFKRRVDLPCWHHDHIQKLARLLQEYGKLLEEIGNMNSLLNHEKVSLVQSQIQRLNQDAGRLTPHDPRERGSEMLQYVGGRTYLSDMNGVADVQAREDLDEPLFSGPNMRKAAQEDKRAVFARRDKRD